MGESEEARGKTHYDRAFWKVPRIMWSKQAMFFNMKAWMRSNNQMSKVRAISNYCILNACIHIMRCETVSIILYLSHSPYPDDGSSLIALIGSKRTSFDVVGGFRFGHHS